MDVENTTPAAPATPPAGQQPPPANNQQPQNQQQPGAGTEPATGNLAGLPKWAQELLGTMKQTVDSYKAKETEAATQQAAAEEKALKDQGKYKELADKAEEKNRQLQADLARQARDILAAKVASEAGLPAVLAARLSGNTEEELKKDAIELAKLVKPPTAANTEAGAGRSTAGAGAGAAGTAGAGTTPAGQQPPAGQRRYSFQQAGDITW